MSSSTVLFYAILVIALLIVQVALSLTIKRFAGKPPSQKLANSVLLLMPAIVTFAAILIAQSFLPVAGLPPPGIRYETESIDPIERAAKRIDDLEVYTQYLENYLLYDRARQLILVTGLSTMFCLSLFTVGFGMYKPAEDE
jgi:hypothetical protein